MRFVPKGTRPESPLNGTNAFRNMSDEEVRTVYFSLREYRDNLHQTLQNVMYKHLDEDDYMVDLKTKVTHTNADRDEELGYVLSEFAENNYPFNPGLIAVSTVPQVSVTAMLNGNTEYEEFMFLFETLYKVNKMLFDIMDNHPEHLRAIVHKNLDVD